MQFFDAALDIFQRCLDMKRNVQGNAKDSVDVAVTLQSMALVHWKGTCDLEQSLTNYQECLDIYEDNVKTAETRLPQLQKHIAEVVRNMGLVCTEQNDFEQALQFAERSLVLAQAKSGKGSVEVAVALQTIAKIRMKTKEHKMALKFYAKSLAIFKRAHGEDHPSFGEASFCIGMCHKELGNRESALKSVRQSLACFTTCYGEHHSETKKAHDWALLLPEMRK